MRFGPNPTLTLVANSYAAFRAAKGEQRVLACGVPANHSPILDYIESRSGCSAAVSMSWPAPYTELAEPAPGGYPGRACPQCLPAGILLSECFGRLALACGVQRLILFASGAPRYASFGSRTLRAGQGRAILAAKRAPRSCHSGGISIGEPGDTLLAHGAGRPAGPRRRASALCRPPCPLAPANWDRQPRTKGA